VQAPAAAPWVSLGAPGEQHDPSLGPQLLAPSMGYCSMPGAADVGAATCGFGWHFAGSPWAAVPQLHDPAAMQFDPSLQILHYGGFAAPVRGFDTAWPEDLGLTLPPGRPKARGRKSAKDQGLRTPSSVGTPVFSDSGSSVAQTAGESADAATEVPSLGASGSGEAAAVASRPRLGTQGSGNSRETSSAKSEPEEPARAGQQPYGQQAAALAS